MFVAQLQPHSKSSRPTSSRPNRNNYATSIGSKELLRRPVHHPFQRPNPLPPDPGVGASATQQQQQHQQPAQKQQEAGMGTISKLMGGVRSSQDQLVDYLIRSRLVKTPRVAEAMRAVDRGEYVNHAYASRTDAYQDHPLAIGEGQTISAPHMHAICLELLEPHLKPGARVLDVGSGSGYLSACLAKLVSPHGFVLGVDKVPELVVRARSAVAAANPELLAPAAGGDGDGREPLLRIVHGNALGDLLVGEGPFDAIHVGAAADELHQILLDKLAPGGRMIIPVGPHYSFQVLMAVDKDAQGVITKQDLMDVGYVPLTRPSEFEDGQLPGPSRGPGM